MIYFHVFPNFTEFVSHSFIKLDVNVTFVRKFTFLGYPKQQCHADVPLA